MRLFLLLICAVTLAAAPKFVEPPILVANPNAAVPLAAVLKFSAGRTVRTTISITDGKHSWELHYGLDRNPALGLPVIGMRPGRRHQIRVTIQDATRKLAWPKTLAFTTPALPTGELDFPPLHVKGDAKRMEPGITMMTARREESGANSNKRNQAFGMLLAIDEKGEVVWYYKAESRVSGFHRRANGNLLFFTQDFRLFEIDMLGNTIAAWYAKGRPLGPGQGTAVDTLNFHHDFSETAAGTLIMLGSDARTIDNWYTSEKDRDAPRKTQKVMGDEILEVSRDGKVLWKWNTFEHMDPFRIGYETFNQYWMRRGFPDTHDWTHANSASYDEKDDAILISFRHQSAIFKFDRKTHELRWILGEPSGWPDDLRKYLLMPAPGMRWFWQQHSPRATANGTLLVFDNGNYGAQAFQPPLAPEKEVSRAVEYAIDEKNKTVREVWSSEIEGERKVVSIAMGSVQPLPFSNNILVGYGWLTHSTGTNGTSGVVGTADSWSRVREFSHTKPAQLVWEVVMGDEAKPANVGWHLFSAERWPSLVP